MHRPRDGVKVTFCLFLQETAVNIAHSCKLFSADMRMLMVNARNRDVAESIIKDHLRVIESDPANG